MTPMDEPVVDQHHPLALIVLMALRDGRQHGEGTPAMMARAVRAIMDTQPDMTITDAYGIVNRLWVR